MHTDFVEIGSRIGFTARDIQNECKNGLPWEKQKFSDIQLPSSKFKFKINQKLIFLT